MIATARAPLRLGLAGGGTDVAPYCDEFGGWVTNVTIDRYAYASVAPAANGRTSFHTLDANHREVCSCDGTIDSSGPLQLLKGAYIRICNDFLGGERPLVVVRTFSEAPPGSGLGSSSALMVAIVRAFTEYFSLPLGESEIAHLAYVIERHDLAMAGGKQDQYAATFGGFNFMEFYGGDRVFVNPLQIKERVGALLEASLVLYFTGVSRSSAIIIEEQTRSVAAHEQSTIDSMHRLKSEAVSMREALLRGDLNAFARTLQAGWEAKKGLVSVITNPEIDRMERLAFNNGAVATKVSGAGGGGFMMFMCQPENRSRLIHALTNEPGRVQEFRVTNQGATSWRAG